MTRLSRIELQNNAKQKLVSAKKLLDSNCFNDSVYLAGYSIELALKYKFCEKLNIDFPDKNDGINLFTHNLKHLLYISGEEPNFQTDSDWTLITNTINWSEQLRYDVTVLMRQDVDNMINACQNLLLKLNI